MKYFFFALFVWLVLFPGAGRSQELKLRDKPSYRNAFVPVQTAKLPLEWRGLWLSFDATNRLRDRFSRMSYGMAGSAVIGYQNYNLRLKAVMPISDAAWYYQISFEYQVF